MTTKTQQQQGIQANTPQAVIPDDLLRRYRRTKAEESKVPVQDRVEKSVSPESFTRIIDGIKNKYNVEPHVAFIGLCATLQAGGTNKNRRSNVMITISNIRFQSKEVNKIITDNCKDFTPRQFASFFRDVIFRVSQAQNITGNAYVSLRRQYSHLLTENSDAEKFWAADFQLDNPKCPEYIRKALQQRYNDKFIKR